MDNKAAAACPRCAGRVVRPLGNAGSTLEWYACQGCLYVWVTGAAAQRSPAIAGAPVTPNDGRQHVLVVDDDVNTLALVKRALDKYRVSVAQDGLQALAILSAERPVDLLLTDYLMPVMTGEELVRRAQFAQPTLKVLVMTGYAEAVSVADPTWCAAERLVAKPFRIEALRRAVEELIGPPPAAEQSST